MKVVDLIKEQKLILAKYFTEVEEGFIIEVNENDNTSYLSEQICMRYKEVSDALKRYMEIDDKLNKVYSNTYIQVLDYKLSLLTGVKLLEKLGQGDNEVLRDPATGKLIEKVHPMGVFLNMCSIPCKYTYSNKPREYLDPLGLADSIVIEDVLYKLEEFLIQLDCVIDKAINEIEV